MITLSRLNGQVIAVNPDLIAWVDVTPDTTISLLGGDKIMVRESLDEVIARVIAFRRALGDAADAHPPSRAVLQGAAWGRERESGGEPLRHSSAGHRPSHGGRGPDRS